MYFKMLQVKVDNTYSNLIHLVRQRGCITIREISKSLNIPLERAEMLVFRGVNESHLHKSLTDHVLKVYPKYLT